MTSSSRLPDLIDLARLQRLLDGLSVVTGASLSLIEPDGTILAAAGWQDICTAFHRAHQTTLAACLDFDDTVMRSRVAEGTTASGTMRCPNGLCGFGLPLIVGGHHLATVFASQFFYKGEAVNREAFKIRARELGFDETAYLAAVDRVPTLSHERVEQAVDLLGGFVGLLADLGLTALERQQEEDALRESEERYRQLFEAESDAVFLIDNESGRILQANSAAAAMYGYDRDKLLELTNEDLSAEPEQTAAVTHGTPLVEDNVVTIPLRMHRRRDGSAFPVEITGRFFVREGRPVHIAAVREISARLAAEDALRLSEDKFAKAFHGSPDAVLITRASDGLIVEVNEGFTAIAGYSRAEALGRTTLSLELWADPRERERVVADLQAGTAVRDRDVRFRTRSGEVRDCLVSCSTITVDGAPHVLTVVRDVTEQRRTVSALRRSEALLRGILDNVQDAYVRTDAEGNVVMVSPSTARLYGFDAIDDMVGMAAGDLYAGPDGRGTVHEHLQERGQITDLLVRGRRRDGSTFWASLNAQFHRDDEGCVAGTEGFIRDITERIAAESEVRRLNDELEKRVRERTAELEDANRELESFAYAVSHDLRQPLRALDGFSQILLDDYGPALDDEGRSHLQRILAADRRMGALIDALLELSRLNRGRLDRESLDVSELARGVAAELAESEPERRVEVVVADGLTAAADRRLVRALLANLIGNAWKFTARHPTARIEVGVAASGGRQAFFVRDDGVGFDMAYADKLFGAFQRLHSPGEFDGLGIGLATVHRIVRRHGGRVWAEGEIERGATFWFTLDPAETGSLAAPGHRATAVPGPDWTAEHDVTEDDT